MATYSGSYIGSRRSADGMDMIYTYPPDFVMVFTNYRKQSSWDRDAILARALMEYVNKPGVEAPKVVWDNQRPTLIGMDKTNVPTGIEGGEITPEAEVKVKNLVGYAAPEKKIKEGEKLGGIFLLIGFLVVIWYLLFGNIRKG